MACLEHAVCTELASILPDAEVFAEEGWASFWVRSDVGRNNEMLDVVSSKVAEALEAKAVNYRVVKAMYDTYYNNTQTVSYRLQYLLVIKDGAYCGSGPCCG